MTPQRRERAERIVAALSVPGAKVASVAYYFGISESTARHDLTDLYRELGVGSLLEAALVLGILRKAA